jgi:hypothetical protein
MPNTFTLAGYDAQLYFLDWSAELFNKTPIGGDATALEQIVGVTNASIGIAPERLNRKAIGRRTRRFKNVLKREDSLSIEMGFHDDDPADTKNAALTRLGWHTSGAAITVGGAAVTDTTTPGQAIIVISVDVDRDGVFETAGVPDAGNLYFATYSAIVDKIDISGAVNEPYNVKIDFCVGQWKDPQIGLAAPLDQFDSMTSIDTADTIHDFATTGSTYTKDAGGTWVNTGALDTGLESWNLSINNNCIKRYDWTNKYPRMIEKGALDITGNMVIDWVHDGIDIVLDQYDEIAAVGGEQSGPMTFTLSTGNAIILNGVTYDAINLDINETALTMQNIPFTADGITSWS